MMLVICQGNDTIGYANILADKNDRKYCPMLERKKK